MTETDSAKIFESLARIEEMVKGLTTPAATAPDGYLTLHQAASIAAVCISTLRRAIKENKLKAYDVSRGGGRATWRIARQDLDEFMHLRAVESSPAKDENYKSTFLGM